ncbi:hypothetical protein GCM10009678_33240 [Actinomadura kijaniata]|uniref:Uncharacterized protein n=1 Tax=Actinomadura namibiensis TaxID=182080 RepID=A0A7W3LMR5_ACTNM|nr:hypothetical protein [Actinomadura namibiensis]
MFAWGCVVAFAGTGRAPFAGATVSEALYRISHEPPDLEGLDPALVEPVGAALAKDPAERPTPQDLLVRLTGHAAPARADPGRTAVDPGRTTVEPAPARPRRGRRPLVAGGAALLALGVALGAAGQARLGDGFRPRGKTPATAQAPSPGTPFFPKDGFDNDRGGWDGTGCGVYRDHSLQVSTDTTDATEEYCSLPGERAVADGRTLHEVSVSFASGGSSGYAGLYVLNRENSDDEGSRYEAMLRWDGVLRLRKVVDDDPVRGAVRTVELPGFRAQQANRLQVEVDLTGRATGLRVWVNGRRVLEFTDSARPLRRGTDALAVHQADGADETSDAMARFDDFIITRLH